ncbi:MAG TPA: hypothetical protein VGJ59_19255 [Jatrophihabitantaceae bacterium]|jgi:hypothetical protein
MAVVSHHARRITAGLACIAGIAVLVGCSSSSKPPQSGTHTTSAVGSSPTQAPTSASGQLTKAEFVAQAIALCNSVYAKVNPGPAPTSATDYKALAAYTRATLREFPPYHQKLQALVARSADRDELTAKRVAPEAADANAIMPLLQELVTAIDGHDAGKVEQIARQLQDAPDHRADIAGFLTSYGPSDCVDLQSS